jgi:hypothetical protein
MDRESRSLGEVSVKSLEGTSTFLLKLQGHNILALRLPGEVAKEISSQDLPTSGILSRFKAKLGLGGVDQWRWFTVTSVDNPLLEQTDKFAALVTNELTKATGITITKSDLAISATVPISAVNAKDERGSDDGETHQMRVGKVVGS